MQSEFEGIRLTDGAKEELESPTSTTLPIDI
jgi:hypothetical protein